MDIDGFLERFVEGYLFKDIESMQEIELKKGSEYGACGYPIILSTTAGIELFGALSSDEDLRPFENFDLYWNSVLNKVDSRYSIKGLSRVVYDLARNGISHSFVSKIGILVNKGKSDVHLEYDTDKKVFNIDCVKFSEDLIESYEQYFKPKIDKDKSSYQSRLNNILEKYKHDSEKFFRELPPKKLLSSRITAMASMASTTMLPSSSLNNPPVSGTFDTSFLNNKGDN